MIGTLIAMAIAALAALGMAFAKGDPDDDEILTNKAVAASASSLLSDCTAITTTDGTDLHIHVKITYNAAATQGGLLKMYASYDDGTNFESYPFWTTALGYTAADTAVYASARVPFAPKYVKAQITNQDTGQALTVDFIRYTLQTA